MKTYDYETGMNVLQGIMDYENGEMESSEVIDFFQNLVDTGIVYHLQGSYQRIAQTLIESGVITPKGE